MKEFDTSPKLKSAYALAEKYPEELLHLIQVAKLSEKFFDAFSKLQPLEHNHKELLICAALLHDIGISKSYAKHHKNSLKMILESDLPAITSHEKEIIANIARYHRKAMPKKKHQYYAALDSGSQSLVRKFAAILRIADGLDRAHENAVDDITMDIQIPAILECAIFGSGNLSTAIWGAERKKELFETEFQLKINFKPQGIRLDKDIL